MQSQPIGIFDSGLGGLIITHSLIEALPEYDYLYLGDTARVPYGNRSAGIIYDFTREAVDHLFQQGCGLVIVACNTASSEALGRLQREWLPQAYPDRRLLGVLVPAAEAVAAQPGAKSIGILGTAATIAAGALKRDIEQRLPEANVTAVAAPLLVPLVEYGGRPFAAPILGHYLDPLRHCDTVVLGCTHYPYFKDEIRRELGPGVHVVCQDEIVPASLAAYLARHPEVAGRLTRGGTRRYLVTDLAPSTTQVARELFGRSIPLEGIQLRAVTL